MKMYRILLCTGLVAAIATSCGSAVPKNSPRPDSLSPQRGAVMSLRVAEGVLQQCSRRSPHDVESLWTPSRTEIQQLERRLAPVLDSVLGAQAHRPGTRPQVSEYYRQYVGFRRAGRRLIYVNGAHESVIVEFEKDTGFLGALIGPEWKRSPIVACDGSRAYFGVEYDPATDTLTNFLFNVGWAGDLGDHADDQLLG